jgi:hypothetical protein
MFENDKISAIVKTFIQFGAAPLDIQSQKIILYLYVVEITLCNRF